MILFKFAFITDTHLYLNAPKNFASGLQQQKNSLALYEKLVEQLNAFEPDFVIHGGDIVCGGKSFDMSAEEYETTLDGAQQLPFWTTHQCTLLLHPRQPRFASRNRC